MAERIDFAELTLRETLEIAIALEDKARARYESFADAMTGRSESAAAAFFREMARQEESHAEALRDRRAALFGDVPRTVNAARLPVIEGPADDETPADARQAFHFAKRSEARAYELYTAALSHVADDAVHELLAELRNEEIGHKLMVQEQLDRLNAEEAD